jgi:hypothetical protein
VKIDHGAKTTVRRTWDSFLTRVKRQHDSAHLDDGLTPHNKPPVLFRNASFTDIKTSKTMRISQTSGAVLAFFTSASQHAAASSSSSCPGSPAAIHAKCEMTVTFPLNNCQEIKAEILGRIAGKRKWTDPHNGGTYTLLSSNTTAGTNTLQGSRRTANEKYTDLFQLNFVSSSTTENNCIVKACSESQVTSVLDYSTNYCNLHSLYCNANSDGCPIVQQELQYKEDFKNCRQHEAAMCLSSPTVK